jgi:hypothetical protein
VQVYGVCVHGVCECVWPMSNNEVVREREREMGEREIGRQRDERERDRQTER